LKSDVKFCVDNFSYIIRLREEEWVVGGSGGGGNWVGAQEQKEIA
jgi:hypothetical protein